jgi:chemotaxis protein methyltransferase CheR
MGIDSRQIDGLLKIILRATGTDLTGYRRSTLSRRIAGRLDRLGLDADQYLSICHDDQKECRDLVSEIAIHVSSFFRDPVVYEVIAQSVLPGLIADKDDLRVWSAGCAAGEEACSVAILILEQQRKIKDAGRRPVIFATDIDEKILAQAKAGFYPRESLKDTKLGIVDAYFSPVNDGFELCPEVKQMVHFSVDDLLSRMTVSPAESIYGDFDIILCRNVLIYFSDAHQAQILGKLYRSLAQGGYLVLGTSETICRELEPRFRTVDGTNKIFQR